MPSTPLLGRVRIGARAAGAGAALALLSGVAGAQPISDQVAIAQGLYESAAELIRAGKWAEACPKLEESQRLDPAMGTQFFLATCYAETDRPTSAWSLFLDVAVTAKAAGNTVRESTARQRAAALEPKLPRITVVVAAKAASIPGLTVKRDGTLLKPVVWGTAVPVDLGPHVVRVTAPGKVVWQTTVRVEQPGQRVEVVVPPLASARAEPIADAPEPAASEAPEPPAPRLSGQRRAALAIGSVGLAGIAAGAALGLVARAAWEKADAACPTHLACSREAHEDSTRTLSFAMGSTIAFIAGGALVTTAIPLFATGARKAPASAASIAPILAPGVAGASIVGMF
jgi:hypothetical protein